jgi:hypothetical protein
MVFQVTAQQFLELGLETIVGFDHSRTGEATILCRWHAHYGASPETCSNIFYDLQQTQVAEARVDSPDAYEFLIAFYWKAGLLVKRRIQSSLFFKVSYSIILMIEVTINQSKPCYVVRQ